MTRNQVIATLTFEGETHGEIVVKVRRWLASLDGAELPRRHHPFTRRSSKVQS